MISSLRRWSKLQAKGSRSSSFYLSFSCTSKYAWPSLNQAVLGTVHRGLKMVVGILRIYETEPLISLLEGVRHFRKSKLTPGWQINETIDAREIFELEDHSEEVKPWAYWQSLTCYKKNHHLPLIRYKLSGMHMVLHQELNEEKMKGQP